MKKFLLCLALAFASVGGSVNAAVPVIYGFQTYSKSDSPKGVYTVSAEQGAQPEIYWSDGDLMGNGGAVYVEGKYYVLNYLNFYGMMVWSYLVCDLENKTFEFSMPEGYSPKDVGSALTYDPSTGIVYSVCIDEAHSGKYSLSTMNFADGKKTPVVTLKERILVMAATVEGVLYGIAADGNLYTVDKITGEATLVGATGVTPADLNQSAVIDYDTNIMYWAAMTDASAGLYTVDLATGAATLVSEFADRNQLVGITLCQSAYKATSPAAVEDLVAVFNKADLKGKLEFTMPAKDASGNALEGTLTYAVTCNGKNIGEGSAEAGAKIALDVEVAEAGTASYVVVTKNAAGEGSLPTTVTLWVGADAPAAVTGLTAELKDNEVVLSWDLSETGVHGGYIDADNVRYRIVRYPENVVVAEACESTTFTENFDINGMAKINYTVTPFIGTLTGPSAKSEDIIVGKGLSVPFTEDLSKPGTVDLYSVEDINGDRISWYFSDYFGAMIADYTTASRINDDWLFSPRISLEAGYTYKLTLNLRSAGERNWDTYEFEDRYAGKIGASLGLNQAVDAMTQTIIPDTDIIIAKPYDLVSEDFEVSESGSYHLGLSHTGESSNYSVYLYSISMEITGMSGVNDVAVESGVSVISNGGVLSVVNPDGCEVTVCTTDGRVVFFGTSSTELSLSSGLYLVSTPSRALKVLVR